MNLARVLLLLSGCYTTLAAICPTDWQRYGESCYLLITRPSFMNWHEAKETCFNLNAFLTVPNSQMKQTFIWNMFSGFFNGTPHRHLWIGCNDIQEEGNWQPCPLRSEPSEYQNWEDGRPDVNVSTNCAAVAKNAKGKWIDIDCGRKRYVICELSLHATIPVFCLQSGPDGRIKSQCLVGHVMKELRADGEESCGKACRSEPRCRPFNLLMKQGPGKMICQLNNATRHEATDVDMMERDNCYFFDL